MSDENNYQEFDIDKVPSLESIKYAHDQITAIAVKSGFVPNYLLEAVRIMEREYNEANPEATISISRKVGVKLLSVIDSEIKQCVDNPMYKGIAPSYFYDLKMALESALYSIKE